MAKVKLIPVKIFGRDEYKPANETATVICNWLNKKHLSNLDKKYIEEIGLNVVIFDYAEFEANKAGDA